MTRRPAGIGMLVPSSNTCPEPRTHRTLGGRENVTVHVTRVAVMRITLDHDADRQADRSTTAKAGQLLSTAGVDVIAWSGTAGSRLGPAHDRTTVERTTAATGVPEFGQRWGRLLAGPVPSPRGG